MSKTIVAIATPIGAGGVGVIRLSGPQSLEILKTIFTPQKNQEFEPRKMVFGYVNFDSISDDCLAVYFKAPHSFTGEDVVEIQMHGGVKLLEVTTQKLIENGAVMAQRGEFSKRAVLNGKMDLTRAEALIDMIYAQTKTEMKVASVQMKGELFKSIEKIQSQLTDFLATVEVALDYPEHEEAYAEEKLEKELPNVIFDLEKLTKTENIGSKIKNGVNVCLVGEPNVGKSSLLNSLVGYNRAIVTDVAGTTRDTIDEFYTYKNIRFNITDTAGIRESKDVVEQEGIRRSLESIKNSDFTIFLQDSAKKTDDYAKILAHTPQNFATVLNKIDENKNINKEEFDLCVSAKTGENVEQLKELIYKKTIDQNLLSENLIITNIRHSTLLKQALQCLKNAQQDLQNVSIDCTQVFLKQAWELLGEITGVVSNETIIDTIFSKFCLGK